MTAATKLSKPAKAKRGLDLAKHRRQLDKDGYTIIENLISEAEVAELVSELDRLERLHGAAEAEKNKSRSSLRTWVLRDLGLLGRSEAVRRLALNNTVADLVGHALGTEYLITDVVSNVLVPGAGQQELHNDDSYYALPLGRPHVPLACNTIWALTDFTRENGATRLLPGSHKLLKEASTTKTGRDSLPRGAKMIYAEMPKGSVMVLGGSVWHGGCENRTDERRIAMLINYCAGWLRPEHNNMFCMPLEEIKKLDPRLKELMGFGTYRGILGRIDGQSPLDALSVR